MRIPLLKLQYIKCVANKLKGACVVFATIEMKTNRRRCSYTVQSAVWKTFRKKLQDPLLIGIKENLFLFYHKIGSFFVKTEAVKTLQVAVSNCLLYDLGKLCVR